MIERLARAGLFLAAVVFACICAITSTQLSDSDQYAVCAGICLVAVAVFVVVDAL